MKSSIVTLALVTTLAASPSDALPGDSELTAPAIVTSSSFGRVSKATLPHLRGLKSRKLCDAPACTYDGKQYCEEESFLATDGCNRCKCAGEDGAVGCTRMMCTKGRRGAPP
mmetsp:Transcript_8624/g.25903  ORF Transcript_8624/g.25903 Transcript_8624/m.25903 type:complete len:112 (-) Transcript_8624:222-557(-)